MFHRGLLAEIAFILFVCLLPTAASAQGEVIITQAKALAGNVTPGDAPGFPVTLSRSGAYIFGSGLTVTANQHGILANAHNIDIDMNGFTLTGNGVANSGIVSGFGESRIRGGVINRFKQAGIYLRNNAWVIEDIQIVRNGGTGIDATDARYITVRRAIVAANSASGVMAGQNLSVYESEISRNSSTGIFCRFVCHISNSVIDENSGDGIIAANGFITGNSILYNKGYGVFDQSGSKDTGMANNMLAYNNILGASQTTFTVDVHPNTCVGKPCVTP